MIRKFKKEDAEHLLQIYNHYVKTSTATSDLEIASYAAFSKRMLQIAKDYPFIVYEEEGTVIAYAYASEWKAKHGYHKTVESTIYLSPKAIGKGLGTKVYRQLIKELKILNYNCVIGCLSLPNAVSVALHEKLGFIKVAHFPGIAFKFNKKVDVGYWQLDII